MSYSINNNLPVKFINYFYLKLNLKLKNLYKRIYDINENIIINKKIIII